MGIRLGRIVLFVKKPWNPPLDRCNSLPASGTGKPTSDSNFIGLFSSTFPVANFPQHLNFSSLPWLPGSNGQLELVVWVKIFDEPPTLVDSCSLLLSVDFSIGHVNPGNRLGNEGQKVPSQWPLEKLAKTEYWEMLLRHVWRLYPRLVDIL